MRPSTLWRCGESAIILDARPVAPLQEFALSAPTPDRLEADLADRYTVIRELGHGGMATVYLARDLAHEREVALKVLLPDLASPPFVEYWGGRWTRRRKMGRGSGRVGGEGEGQGQGFRMAGQPSYYARDQTYSKASSQSRTAE
jgi:serine/threonine protein kinase